MQRAAVSDLSAFVAVATHRSFSRAAAEAGERLLERLRPALRDIDDALEDANAFRAKPAGRLRLNVPRSAALLLLAPVMTRFIKAYPQMRLEITAEERLVDIVAGGYDAGVRFGEGVERDM